MKDTERDLRTLFNLSLTFIARKRPRKCSYYKKKNKRHIYKTINVKLDFMTCIY